MSLMAATMAGTVYLYGAIHKGFFPQQDNGIISGTLEAGQDVSYTSMVERVHELAKVVTADRDVRTVWYWVGANPTVNTGRMQIDLKPFDQRTATATEVVARLRRATAKVPGIDTPVGEGDAFKLGGHEVRVLDTPGHTAGHISYWLPSAGIAFVGDTLFAIGCGRVIEGNAQMMWNSLQKLMALPKETTVYCGHEYTQANAKFALSVEPENAALQKRAKEVDGLRAGGKPTLPTTIGLELETNPFLRPASPAIQKRLGMAGKPEWQIFGEIRERKNRA